MEKIRTMFERGERGRVVPGEGGFPPQGLEPPMDAVATEKVDGTNVRLTVRRGCLMRLEARQNPTKQQKADGIIDPWYRDADGGAPVYKYVAEAASNTDLSNVPDGEWSGEAVGPKIQGNPLGLDAHTVVLFSVPSAREHLTFAFPPPRDFEYLRDWLNVTDSRFSPGHQIEGVVWWSDGRPVAKIKRKDFG